MKRVTSFFKLGDFNTTPIPSSNLKLILSIITFSVALISLSAAPPEIVYTDGRAYVRGLSGNEYEATIGEEVNTGDTISTESDGYVELEQNGVTVKILSDTVFTIIDREENSKKTNVFSVILGSVSYKFERITGSEPSVQTTSFIAGVRGTRFTVLAGFDGSSIILVKSGKVAVRSQGKTLELKENEGAEIQTGEPPGKKFKVLTGKIDFSKWNKERFQRFLENPVDSIIKVKRRMDFFTKRISELYPIYLEKRARLDYEKRKNMQIREEKGKAASEKYFKDVIFPLSMDTTNLVLNIRYYALSALSLRRYIMGRMYLNLKTKYITRENLKLFKDFNKVYYSILDDFEKKVVPWLVDADI